MLALADDKQRLGWRVRVEATKLGHAEILTEGPDIDEQYKRLEALFAHDAVTPLGKTSTIIA